MERTAQIIPLLLLFSTSMTTGCQHQGTVVATYTGALSGGSEKINLLSTGKYLQTFTYHNRASGTGVLLGRPLDVPFTLYAKGTWLLIDSSTGFPMSRARLASGDWRHADVEIKSAIGPAPFEEGEIRYTHLDRKLPAGVFRLTQNFPTK